MIISRLYAMAVAIVICTANAITGAASPDEFTPLYAACQKLLTQPLEKAASEKVLNAARGATDPDTRCRAMAIFTISAILQDDPDGYKQRLASMNSIFPESPLISYATPEKLSAACTVCGGSGKASRFCGECNGKGACLVCSGTGRFKQYQFDGPDKLVDCKACSGTGHCKRCQGAGKTDIACRTCGGRGQALSKGNARSAYLAIVKETSDFCYQMMHPEIARIREAVENARDPKDLNAGISVLQELIAQYPKADNINDAKAMLTSLQEQLNGGQNTEPVRAADRQE